MWHFAARQLAAKTGMKYDKNIELSCVNPDNPCLFYTKTQKK